MARRRRPSGLSLVFLAIRYAGYLVLAVVVLRLLSGDFDLLTVGLCLTALFYFGFWVPAWCGAITRQGQFCRNNATGLLMGCHLREHRFQKLRLAIVPRSWRALAQRCSNSPVPTLGAVVAGVLFFLTSAAAVVQAVAAVIWH